MGELSHGTTNLKFMCTVPECMEPEKLSEREQKVLEAIVRNYILSAAPTSSRYLSKQSGFDLSPASIRNVMGDLEEGGYIAQPHTSAGRIPTDKGYRYYVDCMMCFIELPEQTKAQIRTSLTAIDQTDLHLLMEAASRALSRATNQLGVILAPRLKKGIFRQVHIFSINSGRYLMNVAIDSGFVKTMVVELQTVIPQDRLELACRVLTSRFSGMTLSEIDESELQVLSDIEEIELGIVRLLVPSLKRLVEHKENENVYADGQTNVMLQPEFFSRERICALIEILEEKTLLMHLFDPPEQTGQSGIVISIGEENQGNQLHSFSIIKSAYQVGNLTGSLGVIGPKRMPYPYLVSTVTYTARLLRELYS